MLVVPFALVAAGVPLAPGVVDGVPDVADPDALLVPDGTPAPVAGVPDPVGEGVSTDGGAVAGLLMPVLLPGVIPVLLPDVPMGDVAVVMVESMYGLCVVPDPPMQPVNVIV